MDATHLYLELLECGESLAQALAEERRVSTVAGNSRGAHDRLRAAQWEVERAVEYYTIALRTYRVATLSEFIPGEARGAKDRETPRRAASSRTRAAGAAKANCASPCFHVRRVSTVQ
jgi:hypothetical protein